MPIHAICPSCTAEYHLPDQQAGKKVRCKQCQAPFRVEAAAQEPEDVVEAEVVTADEADAIDEVEVVEEVEEVEEAEEAEPSPRSITPSPRIPTAALLRDDPPAKPTRGSSPRRGSPSGVTRDNAYNARTLRDLEGLSGPAEEEEGLPEPNPPAEARSKTPLIISGAVAALLLVGGGITAVLLLQDDSTDHTRVAASGTPGPTAPAVKPPEVKPPEITKSPEIVVKAPDAKAPEIKPPEVKPPEVKPPVVAPPAGGRRDLSDDKATIDKVKRATVYIEVMDSHGRRASGTGFFGVPDARNLVLTNAHVVGMLAPDSRNPRSVDVFVNNGQAGERKLTARVVGVDRGADLAVLDVGSPDGMPEPLRVATSETLSDLQKLWVFGFPLGKQLGKEITIRDTSVSSFRKDDNSGVLKKIQVNGGMDPGSSGGPVVDANGQVVGVAVSGIPGRQINFAIPGEQVHGVLKGRASVMSTGLPFHAEDKKVGLPVTVEMLDPLSQVKQVAVEVWTSPDDKSKSRPPATGAPPAPQPGDSQRKKVALTYDGRAAKGEAVLPDLPAGKTYWLQPTWTSASGESRWAAATPYKPDPATPPLDRKPISLVLRNARGPHGLMLRSVVTLRVGSDDDTEAGKLETKVTFRENVTNVDGSGAAMVDLHYLQAERFVYVGKNDKRPSQLLEDIKKEKGLFEALHVLQRVDAYGNVSQSRLDKARLRAVPPDLVKKVDDFHEPTAAALHALSVTMPNKRDVIQVGESWKGPPRPLPIDTPGKFETGSLEITYTYLGQRRRGGHDEAVIAIDGVARGGKSKDPIGGRASGLAAFDLASGQISQVDTQVVVDMEAVLVEDGGSSQPLRVLATFDFHLKRD
jgi:S1-C subfamily serine protease